ncbi:hypothetical protein OG883_39470 [Streptomyces sp. NBC_01142]|uniref:hypothetical protein n=1 Tax=Streptomyces sp. NBC_01142 TaxID=2975865 RepID=UPI002251DF37|nr:hypothetical protein [Streptomyces sp. NBC_01142]MCX4825808.1 hypothetical protein [Streptomyces sp. NBC_01142]
MGARRDDDRLLRWSNSTNPHLLISRKTATTAAVGTFWMDKLVKQLPVGIDRLQQDRSSKKLSPTAPTPLHLSPVFSIGAKTSHRYTSAVATSAAEQVAPSVSRSRLPRGGGSDLTVVPMAAKGPTETL